MLHAAQNVQAAGAGAEQSQATAATLRPLGVGPNRSASMPALDKINLSTASSDDDGYGPAGGSPGDPRSAAAGAAAAEVAARYDEQQVRGLGR